MSVCENHLKGNFEYKNSDEIYIINSLFFVGFLITSASADCVNCNFDEKNLANITFNCLSGINFLIDSNKSLV